MHRIRILRIAQPDIENQSAIISADRAFRSPDNQQLHQDVFDDSPGNIRETFVAAVAEVSQRFMIEAEQMQDRGVQVVDMNLVLGRSQTDCIG